MSNLNKVTRRVHQSDDHLLILPLNDHEDGHEDQRYDGPDCEVHLDEF